ncbi:type I glyceraldehyde-3-phosphate dehydrogenase [Desulfoplanes formicivorans]|uniref:Glyceraldehyde-3-phosphate dehydrogenase n=1 Tax=Desulfoplanes formicivorans TaxID=1592317 RepID=A0A194AJ96_9BACT|nr:type I glyceraldehyde-3-phosphate dehydrogenase [Desulfoplanes formicivorans]GAU09310.1 type I glyceraldehyde-3-phosphate dehydrogenase [Desulfoplanes formicivorans]
MNTIKIGINGFGRIGRQVVKTIWEQYRDDMEIVAVNDLFDIRTNAHLLQHDTSYGRFPAKVNVEGDTIVIDGQWRIVNLAQRDPADLPWKELGVDIVIESTGIFRTGEKARAHLDAGAKKVIISAPAKGEDLTLVMGVNEEMYNPQKHHIVSNASCTTNGLAPVVKVLHEQFGILKAVMTTIHSYTNDQRILDLPHKDLRRARAAACNMIPTTTGAAKAVALVIPELEGRFDGFSVRVPTPTVSLIDLVAVLQKETTTQEVRKVLHEAAAGSLKGILGYTDEPLVSSDYKGDPRSGIVEQDFTTVQSGNLLKTLIWYDNEWGYSCRVADLAHFMAQKGM